MARVQTTRVIATVVALIALLANLAIVGLFVRDLLLGDDALIAVSTAAAQVTLVVLLFIFSAATLLGRVV